MIVVKEAKQEYGKYFLANEAPAARTGLKFNTKLLDIKPTNRRKLDFTTNISDPEDEALLGKTAEEIDNDYINTPADDTNQNGFTDSQEPYVDDPNNTSSDDENLDLGDKTDFTTTDMDNVDDDIAFDEPEDFTAGVSEDLEALNDGSTKPKVNDNGEEIDTDQTTDPTDMNAPDVGDDDTTDFTMDDNDLQQQADANAEQPPADDTALQQDPMADPNAAQPPADPNAPQQGQGPGLEYDSTRKYILFLNFETLVNTITNYIDKLESILGDDLNVNKIIKTGVEKLREIKDLSTEYMLMKFDSQTYFQSRLFYQNACIMVQSTLNLLDSIKKYRELAKKKEKSNNKTDKSNKK